MFNQIIDWFSHLFKGVAWDVIIAHFQWNDWFLLTMILLGILYGAKQGFIRQIVEILETCVITAMIIEHYPNVSEFFRSRVPIVPWNYTEVISFFLLLFSIWITFGVVDRIMREWIHANTILGLKLVGGIILGAVNFILITSLFVQGILLIPSFQIKKVFEGGNSYTGIYMVDLAQDVHGYLFHPAQMFSDKGKLKK